jgi:hypothetical protein
MKLSLNWQHVAALAVTLAPVVLHALQVLKPSWYSTLMGLAGPVWLLLTRSVLVDPGVKQAAP